MSPPRTPLRPPKKRIPLPPKPPKVIPPEDLYKRKPKHPKRETPIEDS
jgi:hypothetical protein